MGIQALILAAGRGSRLGSLENGVPKSLLEVGRRRLINHMLDTLSDAGIGPVAMVLGYGAHEIREVVGAQVDYIINSHWETTNSLYSFSLARSWVKGSVMILNCDLLLHPEIIVKLISRGEDSIAIDTSSGDRPEQMAVKLRAGLLEQMGKDLTGDNADGENVGILYLSAETALATFDKADELLKSDHKKEWIGFALNEVARYRDIHCVDIAGLPWAEIDFPYDLNRARKEVWPEIHKFLNRRIPKRLGLVLSVILLVCIFASALFLRQSFPTSKETNWDTVDIIKGKKVKITMGDRKQKWWLLKEGESILSEPVIGPNTLRVDTRIILAGQHTDNKVHYLIEISLDGHIFDWFKHSAKASKMAKYEDMVVGKREKTKIEIPEGQHELRIKLIAEDGSSCLVRMRQIERDDIEGN